MSVCVFNIRTVQAFRYLDFFLDTKRHINNKCWDDKDCMQHMHTFTQQEQEFLLTMPNVRILTDYYIFKNYYKEHLNFLRLRVDITTHLLKKNANNTQVLPKLVKYLQNNNTKDL